MRAQSGRWIWNDVDVELSANPAEYLAGDELIEVDHPRIVELSSALRARRDSDVEYARAAFEWVRDQVAHSVDAQDRRVTISAAEVLRERVGLCYAKSHLLAALVRAQGIPAALCYQRLGDAETGYALHGLVAIHLHGQWHRQDPRGNKPGIDAQFSLTGESLAFKVVPARGEIDYPDLYRSPAPTVVTALTSTDDVLALSDGGLPTELTA